MKETQIKICSYDVLPNGKIKPSALQKYFQEIALEDISDHGGSYQNMRRNSMVFVLTKLRIDFYKDILASDVLTLKTFPYKVEGVTFFRAFELWKGETLVCNADSRWVLINYNTRTILRPTELPYQIPQNQPSVQPNEMPRRIAQTEIAHTVSRKVLLTETDENQHLNNCCYSDYLLDHAPMDVCQAPLKAMCIIFEREALLHDEIELRYQTVADGFIATAWNKTKENRCFQAIFTLDFS